MFPGEVSPVEASVEAEAVPGRGRKKDFKMEILLFLSV